MNEVEQSDRRRPVWRQIVDFLVFAAVVGGAAWFLFFRPQPAGPSAKEMMAMMGMGPSKDPVAVHAITVRPATVPVTTICGASAWLSRVTGSSSCRSTPTQVKKA